MPASAEDIEAVRHFDLLPNDAIVPPQVLLLMLGDAISERTLRRDPPVPRRQISERRYGFRVGDIRDLVRGKSTP